MVSTVVCGEDTWREGKNIGIWERGGGERKLVPGGSKNTGT